MDCKNTVTTYSTSPMDKQKLNTRDQNPQREVPTYKPNIWKYEQLLSLPIEYSKDRYKVQAEKLKEHVSCMFSNTVSPLAQLELIDNIDKLGLTSHFEVEIKEALDKIVSIKLNSNSKEDLYATSLCFRILREHGYNASQDMFRDFFDEKGKLMMTKEASDMKTLMELLEGSYQSMEGEGLLHDIRSFATENLRIVSSNSKGTVTSEELSNRLNNPLAWMVRWYDIRRHICVQEQERETNPMLLKLAKLNFNIIQARHQNDLKDILRWWMNLGIVENLSFTRDRIVESFLCAVGVAFEPQHGSMRKWLTRVIELILIIDDVYDIYGSLAEVELFTRALDKWDSNEVQGLPKCMQICFWTLHDTIEDISVEIQKQKGGASVFPYLKQGWVDFCKALLMEAKWYHNGYTPTLDEYLDNGWISSSGPLLSLHVIFSLSHEITNTIIDLCKDCNEIIYHTSLIIRLCNDHITSTAELARGDNASSILCYMQEENVTENVAREHVRSIISDSWKKINYHSSIISDASHRELVEHVINQARMAHLLYRSGDGFGVQDGEIRKQILFNLIEPITVPPIEITLTKQPSAA